MKYKVEKFMQHSVIFYVEADCKEDAEDKIDDMKGEICKYEWLDTAVYSVDDKEWYELKHARGEG